jgi:hypothetical protein
MKDEAWERNLVILLKTEFDPLYYNAFMMRNDKVHVYDVLFWNAP